MTKGLYRSIERAPSEREAPWAGEGGGGGAVSSVFGRIGAVTAQTGDYTAAQVGAVPISRTVNAKALSANITLDTSDIADSANKRYVTDAQRTVLSNTSGTNTGDQDLSGYVPTTQTVNGKSLNAPVTLTSSDIGACPSGRTVNGKALTADIALTSSDVSAVPITRTINGHNLAADVTLDTSDVADSANKRYVTDAQRTVLSNTSGTNTGDQDLSGYVPTSRTVNSKALSTNVTLSTADIADSTDKRYVTDAQRTVISNTSGTNTGDQDLSGLVPTSRTVNGHALSANVTVTAADIGVNDSSTRQTALSGVSSSGRAGFISTGSGLRPGLLATAAALVLSFAAGFNSTAGELNYIEQLSADDANFFPTLPASNLSYMTIQRTGAGSLTGGSTLAPPQDGQRYDRARAALLHMDGANNSTTILDDFGNTWTAVSGAKLQTGTKKFGTAALGGSGASSAMNGTSDEITCSALLAPSGSWSMRAWANPSVNNALHAIMSYCTSAAYGALLCMNASGKFAYYLSSNNSSWDIASGTAGTTTASVGTWYFVELTFDAVAGVYRLYVNGTQEASTTSSTQIYSGSARIGSNSGNGTFWSGYIDEAEFLPYCDHPAGTSYSAPSGAQSITATGYAQEWFDVNNMVMKQVSGASSAAGIDPSFIIVNKLYVGEVKTGASTVTTATSYAFSGYYESDFTVTLPGTGTKTTFSHNIGSDKIVFEPVFKCLVGESGYTNGMIRVGASSVVAASTPSDLAKAHDRLTGSYTSGATTAFKFGSLSAGGDLAPTAANWAYGARARRIY